MSDITANPAAGKELNKSDTFLFFANQVINAYANNRFSANELIAIPKNGDFPVKGLWTFEVGGKNKKEKQISGISDSYVLADEIVIGYDKRIPLRLMGFYIKINAYE